MTASTVRRFIGSPFLHMKGSGWTACRWVFWAQIACLSPGEGGYSVIAVTWSVR